MPLLHLPPLLLLLLLLCLTLSPPPTPPTRPLHFSSLLFSSLLFVGDNSRETGGGDSITGV